MKQLTLDLKNFRKFEELHLDFHPRFTLLMGVNGTGKTSVLQGVFYTWLGILAHSGVGYPFSPDREIHKKISIDVASDSWLTPIFPLEIASHLSWNGRILEDVGLGWKGLGKIMGENLFNGQPLNELLQLVQNTFQGEASSPIPLLARFGASKPQPIGEAGSLKKPFVERKDVWALAQSDTVNAAGLTSWFQYYELRGLQEGKTPLLLILARKAVLKAIHAEEISFVIRENALMVRYADGGWRRFSDLSDGQQRIAAIFCDLAMRCASLRLILI